MTTGNPVKLIVKFTIPLLIGNIFQQMYSISDIIIVGRLIGINALAALGVSAPIFALLVFASIGFTNGLTVITAQSFGAKDYAKLRRSVTASIILCAAFVIAASAITLLSMDIMFEIMNVPEELKKDAGIFTSVICSGTIMIVFFNLLSSFMRALGDSKTPLYFLIFATMLNVAFNFVFIKYLGLGIAGSALGTISAMFVSVICCLVYIPKNFPLLLPKKRDWKPNWEFYKQHLAIAFPMALQFSILSISMAITQSVCNSFGPIAIAGFISAMRVEQIAVQPMVSLGLTMSTFVAQNYGAKLISRIRRGVFKASMISVSLSIFLALMMFAFSESLIKIFIEEENFEIMDKVLYFATSYIKISILFYFPLGQIFIYRNALQGMGNAVIPLISSIVELLMRTFAAVFLAATFGYIGMCFASPIAWIGGGTVTSIGYFVMIKRIRNLRMRKKPVIIPYSTI